MRYDKGHKADTRRRVVETAARRFRRDGIAATGVAGLMADAGLTHGGFYAHFGSKEALVRDAVAAALDATRMHLAAVAAEARAEGKDGLEAIVRTYLRPAHRDRPEAGCAVPVLAAELARHAPETRDVLTAAIRQAVALIVAELLQAGRPASPKDREATAAAIFATMVGALQLARVVSDPVLSDGILAAGRSAALALAQGGIAPSAAGR
jgi:TetR/AcrR family transcriptional regulator, transcriptional repressor for nem operon